MLRFSRKLALTIASYSMLVNTVTPDDRGYLVIWAAV